MFSSWHSKFFAAGTFAVAAPSIGYGGYAIGDHKNPTLDRQLRNKGFVGEPIHSNLTHSSEDNSDYVKKFETYHSPCFHRFLSLKSGYESSKMLYKPGSVKKTDVSYVFASSNSAISDSASQAEGCAFMKIEQANENSEPKNKFSSVLLIRIGSFAIALFVRGEIYPSSAITNKSYVIYSILRMEQDNSFNFEVKEGYSGFDKKLTNFNQLDSNDIYHESSQSSSPKIPYIIAPDGSEWLVGNSLTSETKYYSGMGKAGDSSGQKFFEEIKVSENKSSSGELLGRSGNTFSSSDNAGYNSVNVHGDYSFKSWKRSNATKDLFSTLNLGFGKIKDINGNGLSFEDYCADFKENVGSVRYKDYSQEPKTSEAIRFCYLIPRTT